MRRRGARRPKRIYYDPPPTPPEVLLRELRDRTTRLFQLRLPDDVFICELWKMRAELRTLFNPRAQILQTICVHELKDLGEEDLVEVSREQLDRFVKHMGPTGRRESNAQREDSGAIVESFLSLLSPNARLFSTPHFECCGERMYITWRSGDWLARFTSDISPRGYLVMQYLLFAVDAAQVGCLFVAYELED